MVALGILIPLTIVTVLGTLVAVTVFVVLRIRSGEPLVLPLRTILVAYFHLVSIVAVLILAVGLTTLLKAALSGPLGRSFSYYQPNRELMTARAEAGSAGQVRTGPTAEQLEEQRQRELRRIEQEYRNDLIQGTTMVVVGGVLWPLHAWGRRRIVRLGDSASSFFAKAHLTLLLVLFSLIGVISLPLAIYEALRYLLPEDDLTFRPAPGGTVATALVFVPLWLYYLWTALHRMRRETAEAHAA
jgi:hypothetical protein